MALSRRGRDALAYVNCEDVILRNGIPMRARMLHDLNCHTHPVPYGISPDHVTYLNKMKLFFILLIFERKSFQLIVEF
jgi:kynurenine 3-monooxygenase